MPTLLVHLAAVERLARDPRGLSADLARSLTDDLEYARFGAALPDLPFYAGLGPFRALTHREPQVPPFARLFHRAAPVALGLKLAELVATGSLVGSGAGRAVVSGYFSHLVLDRMLHPLTELIALRVRRRGESARAAHQRVESLQAPYFLREILGHDPVGDAGVTTSFRVVKRAGPALSVGKGLYLFVRTAADEVLGAAPPKPEFDAWVRGLYLYGNLLRLPVARQLAGRPPTARLYRKTIKGPGVDMAAEFERALRQVRWLLGRVHEYMVRGDFSHRANGRFMAAYPESAGAELR